MSFFTYDTKDFTEEDYEVFENLHGVSVRNSAARGEKNRGKLISVDRLLIPQERQFIQSLPKGYTVEPSNFTESSGTICKCSQEEQSEAEKLQAIILRTEASGEEAGLRLLTAMIQSGVLKKRETILSSMKHLLTQARKNGYRNLDVFELYQQIPQLERLYYHDEKTKLRVQDQLDKYITRQLKKEEITNPFDKLFILGIEDLIHHTKP